MRISGAVLVAVLMLTSTGWAQQRHAYVIPSVPPPRDPPPRFTIAPRGAPLAPIGLPLPRLGLQPLPGRQVLRSHRPLHSGRGRVHYYWLPPTVFYVPQRVEYVVEPSAHPKPPPRVPRPGRLILDVQPAHADVFADGYYLGTPAEFSAARGGGAIEPGAYRIDVSAAGYEPATVHVRLVPGQTVTYRATLEATPAAPVPPPTTFYLIPGCYLGNIPPKDAHLPESCDPGRAVTWRP